MMEARLAATTAQLFPQWHTVSSRHCLAGQQDPAPGCWCGGDGSPCAGFALPYCPVHVWLVRAWFPRVLEGRIGPQLCLPPACAPGAAGSSWPLSGEGTAAGFLLLRLDVVMDLEAGLIRRLYRALLQLPGVVGLCYPPLPAPVPVQEAVGLQGILPLPGSPRYSLGNGQEGQLHVHACLGTRLHERHTILLQRQHNPISASPKMPSCPSELSLSPS